ncbi:MAG: type II secretion system F family protein [Candidatus Aenigmarchaeota archaeon]|nr:type II secretion system F family protein [Candidatus Aenigmarchaeota archaeon]
MKISFNLKIIIASIAFSIFLISVSMFSGDMRVLGISLILSLFAVSGSVFLIKYIKYKTLKEMEQRFPFFLRDIIEALRSGVPFHVAVVICSKYDYGKLSQEVKRMANQISWGVPFDSVIDKFAERMKHSRRLTIALKIIRETYLSGGDVVSTLESVADTINTLDDSEKERKSLLSQYVVLMYAINFLFVGIVVGINRFMIPIFQTAGQAGGMEAMGVQNPCSAVYDVLSSNFCSMLGFTSMIFNIGDITEPKNIGAYYTSLFFIMSIVESACCGLVAGQISEKSVIAGIKHSLIMIVGTFGAFFTLIGLGIMGV